MPNDQQRPGAGSPGDNRWRLAVPTEVGADVSDAPGEVGEPVTWAIGFESLRWDAPPNPSMSRREFRASRGPYRASVPPHIANLPVDLDDEVAAESAEAAAELVRFDAELSERLGALGGGELSPLAAVLLRTESASSSQIEHITAGARALALARLGEKTGENAALVATNTDAMQTAIALSNEISAATIIDVQRALLERTAPEHTGKFREEAVWIGTRASTPHTASFVAPHWSRVPGLIDDLVAFSDRTDVPPFAQAAIAHGQFETIHPFPDGNGRTGRALVHAMLRKAGITRRLTVPVSSGLLANVEGYYEALTEFRKGDLNPIVSEFSAAAFGSCSNGRVLVEDLVSIHDSWRGRVRARRDAVVWRALPIAIGQPAMTVPFIADKARVSFPAAQRAIDQMVDAEVVQPLGNQKRSRVWVATEVVEALDAFATRTGRRRYGG